MRGDRRGTATWTQTTGQESTTRCACAVHEVAPCVTERRPEIVCVTPHVDEVVPTPGSSDQSNYSGVYERELEVILESVSCCRRRRRRRNVAAASPSSRDEFYFRLPQERQSYRSSSASADRRSADSESEPDRKLPDRKLPDRKLCASSSDDDNDELNLDEESPAADAAFDRRDRSFFRRLNRFLLSGNHGPAMAVIEP